MKVRDITNELESLAPKSYQESYDNAGLITGQANMDVTGVLFCLDSTEAIIDEAIARGCNMIVAHHPIVFKGLKTLTGRNYVERIVIKAIKNDIALYAIHTNLDNVRQGVNEEIADRLGLHNRSILMPKSGLLTKLEVFCPATHIEALKKALFEAGAGQAGNYDMCSFSTEGKGTFRPLDGAEPHVGALNQLSEETELRLELIFPSHLSATIVATMNEAHPYEEVAHQLIPLLNAHQDIGTGIIGELDNDMETLAFLAMLKEKMEVSCIRYTEPTKDRVKKIAVVGGSGSFAVSSAMRQGADILVTADMKYHEFFDADGQMLIADIGHYESEHFTSQLLQRFLSKKFPTFALLLSELNTNPVNYL